jgi:hypothetical protein
MDDFIFCGNIVPKFPGGPRQGGLALATVTLLPTLSRVARLDPEPEPWKALGGIVG